MCIQPYDACAVCCHEPVPRPGESDSDRTLRAKKACEKMRSGVRCRDLVYQPIFMRKGACGRAPNCTAAVEQKFLGMKDAWTAWKANLLLDPTFPRNLVQGLLSVVAAIRARIHDDWRARIYHQGPDYPGGLRRFCIRNEQLMLFASCILRKEQKLAQQYEKMAEGSGEEKHGSHGPVGLDQKRCDRLIELFHFVAERQIMYRNTWASLPSLQDLNVILQGTVERWSIDFEEEYPYRGTILDFSTEYQWQQEEAARARALSRVAQAGSSHLTAGRCANDEQQKPRQG